MKWWVVSALLNLILVQTLGNGNHFKDMGDHYLLNGAKLWISNSPFADIAIVWAKNEEGRIKGLIVERGMEGFTTPETHNKWS